MTSFGSPPALSWRVFSATFCGALYALMVLSSVSVVLADLALAEREAMRTVTLSEESKPSDVFIRFSQDYWRGERVEVAFINPAGVSGGGALPPGMKEVPAPGEAVVSPALDSLAREHADLGRLYPRRTVLGDEGVGKATELVAYVRPPEGRGLGAEDRALRVENGAVTGDRITARVAGFGRADGLLVFADEARSRWQVPALTLVLGFLPALLLLTLGMRGSRARSDRDLEAATQGLPVAATGSSRMSACRRVLPGIAVGAVVWAAASSRSDLVPLTQIPVVLGQRALPLTFTVATAVTCIAMAVVALVRGSRRARSRTSWPGSPVTNLRLLPLTVSAVLFAAHGFTTFAHGPLVVAVASIGSVIGVCAVLPMLLGGVGRRLATSSREVPGLVGRSLERGPAVAARPFYGVAIVITSALMFLSLSAAQGFSSAGSASPVRGVAAAGVEWLDVQVGDFANFRAALRAGEALLVGVPGQEGQPDTRQEGKSAMLAGSSCAQLARVIVMDCADGEPLKLTSPGAADLAKLVGVALGEPIASVRLVDEERLEGSGRAVVVGRGSVETLDAATRTAARSALPAALVESDVFAQSPDLSDQRLIDSLASRLLAILGLAALLVAVDRILEEGMLHRTVRDRSTASGSLLRRFLAGRFLAGWWATGLLALAIGYVVRIQTSTLEQRAALWQATGSMVVGLLLGAVLGVAAILMVGPRGSDLGGADLSD